MASFPGQKCTGPALPNQVLGLTATVVNAGQINLSWTAVVPGPTNYNLFRGGALIGSPVSTSFSDMTVAPATVYSYTVQAVNTNGVGLVSTPVNAITPPAQVTGLTATPLSSSSIGTAWTATTGASSYTVDRGGTPVGIPATNAFTDTGLAASTLYSYTVAANGAGGQGAFSSPASATTQAASGGLIPFKPGIRTFANVSGLSSLASIQSNFNAIKAQDVNNRIRGLVISPTWANLEGATQGDYSAGFMAIGNIINYLKSFNPPCDLTIRVNGGGNGYSPNSNPAFLSSFCPSYMNTGTKGSSTSGFGGGEVHIAADGVTPLDRPYIVIWNFNVVDRLIALFSAYYNQFGPDTPTGGIYRWDPYQEFSISGSAPGYNNPSSLNAIWTQLCSGLRTAAPRNLIMLKCSFLNPNDGSSYPALQNAMKSNSISAACEDGAPLHDWQMRAYLGMWTSTPINHTTANGGNPDWDYHANIDPAELFQSTNSANYNNPVPPATFGSGLWYANGSTGIQDFIDQMMASHIDVYSEAFGGPNCNRRIASGSAPPNPAGGPAPGSTASRPNCVDVMSGNTSFTGVQLNGIVPAWITYPFGYPT